MNKVYSPWYNSVNINGMPSLCKKNFPIEIGPNSHSSCVCKNESLPECIPIVRQLTFGTQLRFSTAGLRSRFQLWCKVLPIVFGEQENCVKDSEVTSVMNDQECCEHA